VRESVALVDGSKGVGLVDFELPITPDALLH
jgi:hypothetical protein